ncbi:MAG: hypothetical protein ACYDEP_12260 [Acidimicrobiales bacterium]|jgi:hypothetical protein
MVGTVHIVEETAGATQVQDGARSRGQVDVVDDATSESRAESFAEAFSIDCDDCRLDGTDSCDDCVVSFLLGRDPQDAVVIDAEEARAFKMLERAGFVPGIRFDDASLA